MASDEDHIFCYLGDVDWIHFLKFEILDHLFDLFFLEMTDSESDIVLSNEHFVTLEDMSFPKFLLEYRECIKYLKHEILFDLYNFSQCI